MCVSSFNLKKKIGRVGRVLWFICCVTKQGKLNFCAICGGYKCTGDFNTNCIIYVQMPLLNVVADPDLFSFFSLFFTIKCLGSSKFF